MAGTFPIQLVLQGRNCVVIGGGRVAARKVTGLLAAGANVTVVAPRIGEALSAESSVTLRRESYWPRHLDDADLVFACTNDPAVNRRVADDARARGVWCNVADQSELGDFFVPSVLRRGRLEIAVGTSGESPESARAVRRWLEDLLPGEVSTLFDRVAELRQRIKDRIPSPEARRALYEKLVGADSINRLRKQGAEAWRTWVEQLLRRHRDSASDE